MSPFRWMTKPHYPAISLVGTGAGVFMMGWYHHAALALLFAVVALGGEYLFVRKVGARGGG